MPQHEIEVILMRELASYLAMAIFVVDPAGALLYYNEPAELLLGRRFDETGPLSMEEWSKEFEPFDDEGRPVPPEDRPLMIAVRDRHPAHGTMWLRAADGRTRRLAITAIPLLGLGDRRLGAAAVFWEAEGS